MRTHALNNDPGTKVSGVPFAMTVAGLVISFLAKGRKILTIEFESGIYKWKPKLVADKKSKKQIQELQDAILSACGSVGVKVKSEAGN